MDVYSGDFRVGLLDCHSVCLDESAVRRLRDDLDAWLLQEKTHPRKDHP